MILQLRSHLRRPNSRRAHSVGGCPFPAHGPATPPLIRRSDLNGLTGQIDRDFAVEPVHIVDPLRRDEHLVTEPPVAGLHDEIADRLGFIVDEEGLHVPDVAIACPDVILHDRIAAAQVGIVVLTPPRFFPISLGLTVLVSGPIDA